MQRLCGLFWVDTVLEMLWCFTIYALTKKDKFPSLYIFEHWISCAWSILCCYSIVRYILKYRSLESQPSSPSSLLLLHPEAVVTWILSAFQMTHHSNLLISCLFCLKTNAWIPPPSLKGLAALPGHYMAINFLISPLCSISQLIWDNSEKILIFIDEESETRAWIWGKSIGEAVCEPHCTARSLHQQETRKGLTVTRDWDWVTGLSVILRFASQS